MSEENFNEVLVTGQVDLDGDGVADVTGLDTDGDAVTDSVLWDDADTGESLLVHDNADGSSEAYTFDAEGELVAAEVVDVDGVVTELDIDPADDPYDTGWDEPERDTGDYVVCQVPLQPHDNCCTVEDVTTSDTYRVWVEGNPTQTEVEPPPDDIPAEIPADMPAEDSTIGDTSDANFWFEQSTDFTCGPASATQVIEDFTGVDFDDESAVAQYAADHGWLTDKGMTADHLSELLTDFGVPSTTVENQTWADIAEYLEEDRSVVMFVDADNYWGTPDDNGAVEDSDQDTANHFVRIVGIDTERGVAILSDSGHPDGYQLEVPLDSLEDAWDDVTGTDESGDAVRGHVLVVSDDADPDSVDGSVPVDETTILDPGDDTLPVDGSDIFTTPAEPTVLDDGADASGLFDNPHGWVIVPVVLAATRILAARKR